MGATGFEPNEDFQGQTQIATSGGAKSGALPADLLEVIESWPTLTAADRAAVLIIVRASPAAGAAAEDRQGKAADRTSTSTAAAGGVPHAEQTGGRAAAGGPRAARQSRRLCAVCGQPLRLRCQMVSKALTPHHAPLACPYR